MLVLAYIPMTGITTPSSAFLDNTKLFLEVVIPTYTSTINVEEFQLLHILANS